MVCGAVAVRIRRQRAKDLIHAELHQPARALGLDVPALQLLADEVIE
jgi:hypothetical protein